MLPGKWKKEKEFLGVDPNIFKGTLETAHPFMSQSECEALKSKDIATGLPIHPCRNQVLTHPE